jgi:hypothetical protein
MRTKSELKVNWSQGGAQFLRGKSGKAGVGARAIRVIALAAYTAARAAGSRRLVRREEFVDRIERASPRRCCAAVALF